MNKFLSTVATSILLLSSNVVLAMGKTESGKVEMTTNKDVWGGQWSRMKGKFEEKFGKLIHDENMVERGNREQIAGWLREKNGWTQVQAEKELDQFVNDYETNTNEQTDRTTPQSTY